MPWQWTTDYVNQTAYELSKHNTVICYRPFHSISPKRVFSKFKMPNVFRIKKKNIYVYESTQFIPGQRFPFIVLLNEFINVLYVKFSIWKLSRKKTFSVRFLWFFHPDMYRTAARFGKSFQTVYDCVDYWTGDKHMTYQERQQIHYEEQQSLRNASVVAVNSHVLYRIHSHIRKDILLVPQGFRLDSFSKKIVQIQRIPRIGPIVGYVGAINHRLNVRLLIQVARALKRISFVFVGPIMDIPVQHESRLRSELSTLFSLPNVFRLGNVSKHKIPGVIKQFAIGMIPYQTDNLMNKNCYPMKLFEYFYMGKPVIATSIKELRRFPEFIYIRTDARAWIKAINFMIAKPWTIKYQKEQRELARNNSWQMKIAEICAAVDNRSASSKYRSN